MRGERFFCLFLHKTCKVYFLVSRVLKKSSRRRAGTSHLDADGVRFEERTGLRPRRSQVVPARAEKKKGENEVTSEGAPRRAEPKKNSSARSLRARGGGYPPRRLSAPSLRVLRRTNRLRRLLGVLGVGNTRLVRVPRVVFPHRPDGAAERDDERRRRGADPRRRRRGGRPRRRRTPPPRRRRAIRVLSWVP